MLDYQCCEDNQSPMPGCLVPVFCTNGEQLGDVVLSRSAFVVELRVRQQSDAFGRLYGSVCRKVG